jgi:hypothetical protein
MEDENIIYRIALSGDKKRWRVYGDGKEYICDKIFIRVHQVETENDVERKLLNQDQDYRGPRFVIKAKGKLREVKTKKRNTVIIE